MKYVSGKYSDFVKITGAYPVKPLSYTNHLGRKIVVPVTQYIFVDVDEGIALVGHDYIDIRKDEYEASPIRVSRMTSIN